MTPGAEIPRQPSQRPAQQGEWVRFDPGQASPPQRSSGRRGQTPPVRPPRARRRWRGRLFGYLLVALLALLLGFITGYVRGYITPDAIGDKVKVVIAEGDSLGVIADKLTAAGVLEHTGLFVARARIDGYASQLKPGTYSLRINEPYKTLIAKLSKGKKLVTVDATVPEGLTLEQSAETVADQVDGVDKREYITIARDTPPPVKLKGYETGTTLEGMLFPATYNVEPDIEAGPFIQKQLDAFDLALDKVDMTRARKANLTPYDVVIIASLIEREAQVDEERALVAAVIWNRLKVPMRLQIDATIQYALGETKPQLTLKDLEVDSPYNTYTHDGLPPTPIANPGLASLQAAANPAAVKYLYYVARADGTGKHYFSETYEEFLANQAKAAQNSQ